MALTSGFYPSKKDANGNGDRKYSADQFGAIFEGIITDGIFQNVGAAFQVNQTGDRTVQVLSGRGWFNHIWVDNDAPVGLTINVPDGIYNRMDSVFLVISKAQANRKAEFRIETGTNLTTNDHPTPPGLPSNTSSTTYVRLADIFVKAGTGINGVYMKYEGAGWITAPLKQIDINGVISQWDAKFNSYKDGWDVKISELYNTSKTKLDGLYLESKTNLENLYSTMSTSLNNLYNTWSTQLQGLYDLWNGRLQDVYNRFEAFMFDSEQTFNAFMTRIDEAFDAFEAQKQEEIDEMLSNLGSEFSTFWQEFRSLMTTYLEGQESIWENWFSHIQGQLDEDAAGHLQNQIDAITYIYVYDNELVIPGTAASVAGNELILGNPSLQVQVPAFAVNPDTGHLEYESNAEFNVDETSGHIQWDTN